MKPEEKARQHIDQKLKDAGWIVVNRDEVLPSYGAVAIREELMQGNHEADYLLLLLGRAVGVIEAKRDDKALDKPEHIQQALGYAHLLNPKYSAWQYPLPLVYLANGKDILLHKEFKVPLSVPSKETPAETPASESGFTGEQRFLWPYEVYRLLVAYGITSISDRMAFALLPPLDPELVSQKILRECQYQAINAFEQSIKGKDGHRRALIVLATGAGKTRTACHLVYRLLRYTGVVRRVLFLVDRNNLGEAAVSAFSNFELNGEQPFAHNFGVERLTSAATFNAKDNSTSVYVSTIQRLYSILSGQELPPEADFSEADFSVEATSVDSASAPMAVTVYADSGAAGAAAGATKEQAAAHAFFDVADDEYQPEAQVALPEHKLLAADSFDLIIIDECHRSIYTKWRMVLDYFAGHALMLGLTATPVQETLEFFEDNQVAEYTLEQSINDDINVQPFFYSIKTELSAHGGHIQHGETVQVTSNYTGVTKVKTAQEPQAFAASELNRSIEAPEQIRTILQEYKDVVFAKLYPERQEDFDSLPKTLIFARNERHAQRIVEIAREVFDRPEDTYPHYVQRITYSADNPNELIRAFRNSKDFRIAVTVTLVSTGTDVPALEVLLFLTDVRSRVLYQQMKGRGVRTISADHLREVTPNALYKDRCVLIDAVGVTQSDKVVPRLDRNSSPQMTLERLLEELSRGVLSDDNMLLLAQKLTTLGNRGDHDELAELQRKAPQLNLLHLAQAIKDGLSGGSHGLPPYEVNQPNLERKQVLAVLLDDLDARKKLVEIARGYFKVLPQQQDHVIASEFTHEAAMGCVQSFERSVAELAADNEVLQRLRDNKEDAPVLSAAQLEDLQESLKDKMPKFSVESIWDSYAVLARAAKAESNSGHDRRTIVPLTTDNEREAVTNLLQLMRFAWQQTDKLVSLANNNRFKQLFALWCGQKQNDLPQDQDLIELYRALAQYIVVNGALDYHDVHDLDKNLFAKLYDAFGQQEAQRPLDALNRFFLGRA